MKMYKYRFGLNDGDGKLFEIIIPAKDLAVAVEILKGFLKGTIWNVNDAYINDITEY